MQHVIIFEGPDRAGKSTIAEALAQKFETEVFMTNSKECFTDENIFSKDSSNIAIFNHYVASYTQELVESSKLDKPVIIYRSFLSEMVYSELLGRQTDDAANFSTDLIFANMNATMAYCKNNKTSGFHDDQLKDEQIAKSIELYDRNKYSINMDWIEIDTTEQRVEKYVNQIISYLKQKEEILNA